MQHRANRRKARTRCRGQNNFAPLHRLGYGAKEILIMNNYEAAMFYSRFNFLNQEMEYYYFVRLGVQAKQREFELSYREYFHFWFRQRHQSFEKILINHISFFSASAKMFYRIQFWAIRR